MLRHVWFLGRKDVQYMLRERESIAWMFIMPIVFFYFIGTVTGGFGRPRDDRPDPIALRVTAHGSGFVVDELLRRLQGQRSAVTRVTSDEAFRAAPRRLRLEAPAGAAP